MGMKPHITGRESSKIVTHKVAGLSISEIAKITDRTPDTISQHLELFSGLFDYLENIEEIRKHRGTLAESAELRALNQCVYLLDSDKATLNSSIKAYEAFGKSRRLDSGSPTSISLSFTVPLEVAEVLDIEEPQTDSTSNPMPDK